MGFTDLMFVQWLSLTSCLYSGFHGPRVCTVGFTDLMFVQWLSLTSCLDSGFHGPCFCTVGFTDLVFVQWVSWTSRYLQGVFNIFFKDHFAWMDLTDF